MLHSCIYRKLTFNETKRTGEARNPCKGSELVPCCPFFTTKQPGQCVKTDLSLKAQRSHYFWARYISPLPYRIQIFSIPLEIIKIPNVKSISYQKRISQSMRPHNDYIGLETLKIHSAAQGPWSFCGLKFDVSFHDGN